MTLTDLGWNSYFDNQFDNDQSTDHFAGRVITVQKSVYLVHDGNRVYSAKTAGSFDHKAETKSNFPVVGDWVVFKWNPGDEYAIIHQLLNRQNDISRVAAGTSNSKKSGYSEKQTMVANIDLIFIVSGLDRDYNLRRIERYLTMVYDSQAMPVIILNKADLCSDPEEKRTEVESIAIGVPIIILSAEKEEDAVEPIRSYLLPGYTATLLGSSGVGKSTIINALLGSDRQKVHAVSSQVGKGMHTTTNRELIQLSGGGMIIDTPGMRELQLVDSDDGFDMAFEDIDQYALNCRFSDCSHTSEPGCAVREAIEEGKMDEARLKNYMKLKKEIQYDLDKQYKSSNRIEREKWKKIKLMARKQIKHGYKHRH